MEWSLMWETVECPYCKQGNDMYDGLVDLPSSNKFDYECTNCGEDFEVAVEFEPSFNASEIVYVKCEKCEKESRDICRKGSIFPYPDSLKEKVICRNCFHEALRNQYGKGVLNIT